MDAGIVEVGSGCVCTGVGSGSMATAGAGAASFFCSTGFGATSSTARGFASSYAIGAGSGGCNF